MRGCWTSETVLEPSSFSTCLFVFKGKILICNLTTPLGTSPKSIEVSLKYLWTVSAFSYQKNIKRKRNFQGNNSWFSLTCWEGHVGVQNNGKMLFKFCIVIESNSQNNFLTIVLYTNMVAVTSRENKTLDSKLTRTLILLLFFVMKKSMRRMIGFYLSKKHCPFGGENPIYRLWTLESGTMQFYLFYFIRSEINAIFWKATFWKYNPQKIVRYQELRKHLKRKGEERWKYKT